MNAPVQTMQQLMAQALAMEREAVARYGELAEMIAVHLAGVPNAA